MFSRLKPPTNVLCDKCRNQKFITRTVIFDEDENNDDNEEEEEDMVNRIGVNNNINSVSNKKEKSNQFILIEIQRLLPNNNKDIGVNITKYNINSIKMFNKTFSLIAFLEHERLGAERNHYKCWQRHSNGFGWWLVDDDKISIKKTLNPGLQNYHVLVLQQNSTLSYVDIATSVATTTIMVKQINFIFFFIKFLST